MNFKETLSQLLNPRSRLNNIPSMSDSVAVAMGEKKYEAPMGARSGIQIRDVATNPPLIIGIVLVLGLFALVLYGPVWAPQNPYVAGQHIVPHYDFEKEEYIKPPLVPDAEFPLGTDQWGTDILSLLMHGARNTLIACAFITMLRVLIGVAMGAMAGWNEGSFWDQGVLAVMGILTSLPLLIVAMIMIFALDIRRGLPVFIIALSLIGWTEIAQYVRSEFLVLRSQPFIEGATSVGMTGLQIAVRHVLPNVLPQLLVITFLEMGAVLMLLGELGFVQVYIGGGSQIDLTEPLGPRNIATLADVPEWGAMIADGFRWLRSAPHVVFPPAAAFFLSVMAFNSLGEGLRRMIEKKGLSTAFLLKKRMLVVVGGLTLATIFIMGNTGAAPWFAEIARNFNGATAYAHVEALAGMDGRGIGQQGSRDAANYIAEKMEDYGLEPGWKSLSYEFPIEIAYVQPMSQPELAIVANGEVVQSFRHQLDFGFNIVGHGGSGAVTAPVTFVGFDPNARLEWGDFAGMNLQDRIVVTVQGNARADFASEALIRGAKGILIVTDNERDAVRSQIQLAGDPLGYLQSPNLPIFRIRPAVAEAMLGEANLSLDDIFAEGAERTQEGEGWFTRNLDVEMMMGLALGEVVEEEMPAILGYHPGTDFSLSSEMIVIFTSYDGLGTDPDGTVYPGANHGASGVAIMLELARLWQEQDLDPRRTVLLVAWPHSQLDDSGAQAFLESQSSFRHLRAVGNNGQLLPSGVIQLDYSGAGGDIMLISPNASRQFTDLMLETAGEFDLQILADSDTHEFPDDVVSTRTSWITFKWTGQYPAPDQDTFDKIEEEKLQSFGQMMTLAMTKVLRETNY